MDQQCMIGEEGREPPALTIGSKAIIRMGFV